MAVDDTYTKALLHFNNDYIDESGRIWTRTDENGLIIDASQKKFGAGSHKFVWNGESFSTPYSADFPFGAADFTIDFWLYVAGPAPSSGYTIFNIGVGATDFQMLIRDTNPTIKWYMFDDVAYAEHILQVHPPNPIIVDAWHHIAIVKNGYEFSIYVDGVCDVTGGYGRSTWEHDVYGGTEQEAEGITISTYSSGGGDCQIWLDEFRVSFGIARWIANFTPKTIEYGSADPTLERELTAGVGIAAAFDGSGPIENLNADAGLRAVFARVSETQRNIAQEAGIAADFDAFNWSDFLRVYRDRISIRYTLTMHMASGSLDDIVIPISSFQGQFRTGEPTFFEAIVPGNDQYGDIANRVGAELILTMQYVIGGVVYHSEEICTVDLESIRLDEGSSSASIALSGHRTVTHTPKTVKLTGVSYRAVTDGKIRIRCTPDLYLQPGDTCIAGEDTFTAGVITWAVNPSNITMEVAEEILAVDVAAIRFTTYGKLQPIWTSQALWAWDPERQNTIPPGTIFTWHLGLPGENGEYENLAPSQGALAGSGFVEVDEQPYEGAVVIFNTPKVFNGACSAVITLEMNGEQVDIQIINIKAYDWQTE